MVDRKKGTKVGACVGEALGAPVEFMSAEAIASKFGQVRDIMGGGVFNWDVGEATDDVDMLFSVADSINEKKCFVPEHVAQKLVEWYDSHPKDIGITTQKAISRLKRGVDWTQAADPKGAGNGALIRCIPIVLYFLNESDMLVGKYCNDCSTITHRNDIARWCAVFYGVVIKDLLSLGDLKANYADLSNAMLKAEKIATELVPTGCIEIKDSYNPSGYVVDTLLTSLTCIKETTNFEDAVIKAVNLGGDADSIGSVVGSIAGALYGYGTIPLRWVLSLSTKTLGKLLQF